MYNILITVEGETLIGCKQVEVNGGTAIQPVSSDTASGFFNLLVRSVSDVFDAKEEFTEHNARLVDFGTDDMSEFTADAKAELGCVRGLSILDQDGKPTVLGKLVWTPTTDKVKEFPTLDLSD